MRKLWKGKGWKGPIFTRKKVPKKFLEGKKVQEGRKGGKSFPEDGKAHTGKHWGGGPI